MIATSLQSSLHWILTQNLAFIQYAGEKTGAWVYNSDKNALEMYWIADSFEVWGIHIYWFETFAFFAVVAAYLYFSYEAEVAKRWEPGIGVDSLALFMVVVGLHFMNLVKLGHFFDLLHQETPILEEFFGGNFKGGHLYDSWLGIHGGWVSGVGLYCVLIDKGNADNDKILRVCADTIPAIFLVHAFLKLGSFFSGDGSYGPVAPRSDYFIGMSFPNGRVPTNDPTYPTPLCEFGLSMLAFFFLIQRKARLFKAFEKRENVPQDAFEEHSFVGIIVSCLIKIFCEMLRDRDHVQNGFSLCHREDLLLPGFVLLTIVIGHSIDRNFPEEDKRSKRPPKKSYYDFLIMLIEFVYQCGENFDLSPEMVKNSLNVNTIQTMWAQKLEKDKEEADKENNASSTSEEMTTTKASEENNKTISSSSSASSPKNPGPDNENSPADEEQEDEGDEEDSGLMNSDDTEDEDEEKDNMMSEAENKEGEAAANKKSETEKKKADPHGLLQKAANAPSWVENFVSGFTEEQSTSTGKNEEKEDDIINEKEDEDDEEDDFYKQSNDGSDSDAASSSSSSDGGANLKQSLLKGIDHPSSGQWEEIKKKKSVSVGEKKSKEGSTNDV